LDFSASRRGAHRLVGALLHRFETLGAEAVVEEPTDAEASDDTDDNREYRCA